MGLDGKNRKEQTARRFQTVGGNKAMKNRLVQHNRELRKKAEGGT